MPLPLASALYGVLLGLGFTTFVLSWAVWALAGISVALGEPLLGAAVGAAFGIGRALPVIAMAPTAAAATGIGGRLLEGMAERQSWLRGLRAADALTLVLSALLLSTGSAVAATLVDDAGRDPSAAGGDLVWQHDGVGVFQRGQLKLVLPGTDPAVGGGLLAYRSGSLVRVVDRATGDARFEVDVPGVDKLAISDNWLITRRSEAGADHLEARPVSAPADVRSVLSIAAPGQVGRPAIDGDRVAVGTERGRVSSIVQVDLVSGERTVLRGGSKVQYAQPSLRGSTLLYVAVSRCRQELRLRGPRKERVLLRRRPAAVSDRGHDEGRTGQGSLVPCPRGLSRPGRELIWSTALGAKHAFVTILRTQDDGSTQPRLLSVDR
jgi:hypothetical protein